MSAPLDIDFLLYAAREKTEQMLLAGPADRARLRMEVRRLQQLIVDEYKRQESDNGQGKY